MVKKPVKSTKTNSKSKPESKQNTPTKSVQTTGVLPVKKSGLKISFSRLKKVSSLLLVLIILVMLFAILFTQKYVSDNVLSTEDKSSQSEKKTQLTEEKEQPYEHEIMYEDRNNNPMYVQVFTTAKSDKQLIELNDKLLPNYNNLKRNVLIGYFDDPKIAQSYFQKTDTSDKSRTSHFIASMLYLGQKDPKSKIQSSLTRLSGGVKVLKSY